MNDFSAYRHPIAPRVPKGMGLGLRSKHYNYILENKPPVAWFEAISENYMGTRAGTGGRPLRMLEEIRRNYPVVMHGVSLSIGSVDPLDTSYLKRLRTLADRIEPMWMSDHVCWTGVAGENLHDLLPLPYTRETVAHLVERVQQVQEALGRPFLLENLSSYVAFEHSEMTEWEFLAQVTRRSGCYLLLDVNNIHVSAVNHEFDGNDYLEGIPTDRVAQMHLAGYSDMGTHLIDTHDHPVSDPVWKLYEAAVRRFGPVPSMIEWDDNIPEFPVLFREAMKADRIQKKVLSEPILAAAR